MHFPDPTGLVWPLEPLEIQSDFNELHRIFVGHSYKEDYQILQREVRALGSTVPPLVNAYMNLSSTMRSFGTAYNHAFGETDETGVLVTLRDLYPEKKQRYIESSEVKNRFFNRLLFHINMKKMPWWRQSTGEEEKDELRALKRMKKARLRAEAVKEEEEKPKRRRILKKKKQ
jgi:hypothetical protein